MNNIYFKIFKESFLSYTVIPFSTENLFKTALEFKNKEIFILSFHMLCGFISINIINYLIGSFIERFSKEKQTNNDFIDKIKKFWTPIVFFTSPIQYFGPVVLLMFGYIKFSPLKVTIVGVVGKILYSTALWYL
jgi:membrane protein YqaA with SNARE-associated domain